jgi:uncharacterized Zn-binding protein involved in type VI secretion
MTGHGTPLSGVGSVNVLIGKMPAWRAIVDVHACPLANGPQPHVGGNVLMGSVTVFINSQPAARMGDTITEAGGPNPIAAGEMTVLIG